MHAKSLPILLLVTLLCLLSASVASAQEEGATAPAQTQMQGFEQRFRMIEASAKNNEEAWEALNKQYGTLRNQPTPEEYLLAVARLRKGIETHLASLEVAGMEQMYFKNQLENYAGNNMLLQQELTVITRFTSQLRLFDKQQNEQKAIAEKTLVQLKKYEADVPPPQEFTLRNGMRFRLVPSQRRGSRRTRPFYALAAPVTRAQWKASGAALPTEEADTAEDAPVGEITLWRTQEFLRELTRHAGDGSRFALPTAEHVRVLVKDGRWRNLGMAIWLADKWNEETAPVEAAHRFGVEWSSIWDPARVLGGAQVPALENPGIYPEVPQAAYRQLGCLLVAETNVGIAMRAAKVREKLAAEEDGDATKEGGHAE